MSLLCRVFTLVLLLNICTQATAQSQSVTYCAQSNWLPYEGVRDGRHIGLVADYMASIGGLTGITFEPVAVDNWQQTLDFLSSEQCQLAVVTKNAFIARSDVRLSRPFFDIPHVLVTRSETSLLSGYGAIGERVTGVVADFQHSEYLARHYPDINIVPVSTQKEGLALLSNGDIDVMVASLMGLNSYLRKHNDGRLTIAGIAEPFDALQFAVVSSENKTLLRNINRAISTIPNSRKVAILQKWNKAVVYEQKPVWKYLFCSLLAIVAAIVLFWRYRRGRLSQLALNKNRREIDALQSVLVDKNRTIEFLSNHDTESGLYNRNHMIQKADEEVARFRRFHSPASLVVLEIVSLQNSQGNPASINDSVLIRVLGRVSMTTIREVDIIARWNNEQLVLLCPQTKQSDTHLLTKRLIERLEQAAQGQGYQLVVAAGIAELRDNWSFNDWYEQACSVVYQARRQGGGIATMRHY